MAYEFKDILSVKACRKCRKIKALAAFNRRKSNKDGRDTVCKTCAKKRAKEQTKRYYKNNKAKYKNRMLKYKYGLTLEQYNGMLEKQDNRCAICGQPQLGLALAVDHDHKTGKVRGLLCSNCNLALGTVENNKYLVVAMLEYLKKY